MQELDLYDNFKNEHPIAPIAPPLEILHTYSSAILPSNSSSNTGEYIYVERNNSTIVHSSVPNQSYFHIFNFNGKDGKNGINGNHGAHGKAGLDGVKGKDGNGSYLLTRQGEDGRPGKDGTAGAEGQHGTNGNHGENGQSIKLLVQRSANHPNIINIIKLPTTASSNTTPALLLAIYLDNPSFRSNPRILIECRGGNGGDGGDGGDGGNGGDGGKGGAGGNSFSVNTTGEPFIGKGGRGGHGGRGGNGGNAGKGGDAGNGGHVSISSTEPLLFSLFHFDFAQGNAGKKGKIGKLGKGGLGGAGGRNGVLLSTSQQTTLTQVYNIANQFGIFKNTTLQGINGNNGVEGREATDGKCGTPGSVRFEVIDSVLKKVICTGTRGIDVKILSFRIREKYVDGVFEPNDHIIIDQVTICNDGDIDLPPRAILQFIEPVGQQQLYQLQINQTVLLPKINAQEKVCLPNIIDARIQTISSTLPVYSLQSTFSFAAQVQALYYPIVESTLQTSITIQQPIKMEQIFIPAQCAKGDLIELRLHITNISNAIIYGAKLRMYLDLEIQFLDSDTSCKEIIVDFIPPHSSKTITQQLLPTYTVEEFSNRTIRLELIYNEMIIQTDAVNTKCVPVFDTSNYEIVLVTNSKCKQEEHTTYKRIFSTLNLSHSVWDLSLNQGFKSFANKFKNKIVLFPLYHFAREKDVFAMITSKELVDFFKEANSSLILLSNDSFYFDQKFIQQYVKQEMIQVSSLDAVQFSDYYLTHSPTKEGMRLRCLSFKDQFESLDTNHKYIVRAKFDPQKLYFSVKEMAWKYTYGKADVFQVPIAVADKLYVVDFENYQSFESIRNFYSTRSLFFKVLFTILCSLSIEKRLQILCDPSAEEIIFYHTKSTHLSLNQVIQISIFHQIQHQTLHSTTIEQQMSLLTNLISIICGNDQYVLKGAGLVLLSIVELMKHIYVKSFMPKSSWSYLYSRLKQCKVTFTEIVSHKLNARDFKNLETQVTINHKWLHSLIIQDYFKHILDT